MDGHLQQIASDPRTDGPPAPDPFGRFLKLDEVMRSVGFSQSTVYKLMSEHQFPKPIKLGRMALWLERDIVQWKIEAVERGTQSRTVTR